MVIKQRRPACLVAPAFAFAFALAGCAGGEPAVAPPATAEATGADYVIGPGDTLSIFVYQSPQLSVESLPVRPDGRISVPLVPDINAAGRTPSALGAEIEHSLGKYVQKPNVTVMVKSFVGPLDRQIRVIGEAAQPQAIPYRDNMTVLDVMIVTHGLTKYAAGNQAMIVRRSGEHTTTLHVHLSDMIKDGDISQNVPMRPGDTLIIPQSWF